MVLVSATEGVGDDADGGEARLDATLDCAVRLQRLYQPAVLVAPVAGVPDGVEVEVADELEASGVPVVAVKVPGGGATVAADGPSPAASPSAAGGTATVAVSLRADWREAGRAAAAAAVRACWPAVLAPGLPGTSRGVTFAERRTVELAVLDGDRGGRGAGLARGLRVRA